MDSLYDPDNMDPTLIEFDSNAYYEFLAARPSWGKYFALGDELIFVEGEDAYRVTTGPGGLEELPADFEEADPQVGNPQENPGFSWLRSICSAPLVVGLAVISWARRR